MKRLLLRVIIAVFTLVGGVWLDTLARQPRHRISDCFCTSVQCSVLAIIDQPMVALSHPSDAWKLLRNARWSDGWYG